MGPITYLHSGKAIMKMLSCFAICTYTHSDWSDVEELQLFT